MWINQLLEATPFADTGVPDDADIDNGWRKMPENVNIAHGTKNS
jgi:hypothetical protein